MNGKSLVPLSDLIEIEHGYAFSGQYFTETPTDHVLLTLGNFTKDRRISLQQRITYYDGPIPEKHLLQDGDLLIVLTDLKSDMPILGSAAILPSGSDKKILQNQRIGKVIPKSHDIDREFLCHLLNSHAVRTEIKTTAAGTTARHTSPGKILRIMVWLPKISEQRKIAALLSQWDRAILLQERLITAKNRKRQGLAQQLLSGKKRFPRFIRPEKTRAPTMDQTKASQTTREHRAPYPGAYPDDWEYPRIGEIAHQVTEKNRQGEAFPILSCTKHWGLVDSARYFGGRPIKKDLSTYKLIRRGVFVYATNHIEEGSIGYQDLHDQALVSPMYTAFRTCDRVYDQFLYLILKTERYRRIFAIKTNASVDRRGGLRWKEFTGIRIPLPSREEQQHISRVFTSLDREIHLLQQQLTALRRQKKGLMQKLL
uniref:Restriction endonuclease S subunit n=1 Tax=Candidatus Kentrum sp. MB TaxID=2138164 RepID=A0A450XVN4_9GAMM|nr:MAG: Restriction endonuclease S subunit [Candidatus Kentron sp. MB]VFK33361.1 MAG: Restriction endonuclease S subunit [Candidatus Kentron sp. MB]VFK76135.1 MAG: Restriction endonuclease S subunit [Candidatus Kentron sp. MB]